MFKLAGCLLAGFVLSTAVYADNHHPLIKLQLHSITELKGSEAQGDELYFNVTEYSSQSQPEHYMVPSYPVHWLSDYLSDVKDVVLWERMLQEEEAIELVLSLTERDAPPWNLDDLVGTVKVKFKMVDGELNQHWHLVQGESMPKAVPEDSQDHGRHFMLTSDHSQYSLNFELSVIEPTS